MDTKTVHAVRIARTMKRGLLHWTVVCLCDQKFPLRDNRPAAESDAYEHGRNAK